MYGVYPEYLTIIYSDTKVSKYDFLIALGARAIKCGSYRIEKK